jgi:hypothetical protein
MYTYGHCCLCADKQPFGRRVSKETGPEPDATQWRLAVTVAAKFRSQERRPCRRQGIRRGRHWRHCSDVLRSLPQMHLNYQVSRCYLLTRHSMLHDDAPAALLTVGFGSVVQQQRRQSCHERMRLVAAYWHCSHLGVNYSRCLGPSLSARWANTFHSIRCSAPCRNMYAHRARLFCCPLRCCT